MAAAYKQEITNLTRLVEAGAGFGAVEETVRDELQHRNEELEKERDQQVRAHSAEPTQLSFTP